MAKKKSFNKVSTREMRRAHLQPAYGPSTDVQLAVAAGLPVYVRPVTK